MSKHHQSADLSCSPKDLLLYSQEIFRTFSSPEWQILALSSNAISAKEERSWRTSTGWRGLVQIDITVTALPDEETASRVDLVGSFLGMARFSMGPIAQHRLKIQVDKFLNALSLKVDTGNKSTDETHSAGEGLGGELDNRAERKTKREAERLASASARSAIDDDCRVHAETGILRSVADRREEFRETLNGLLNPEEALVEFVDAFSVQWVLQPNLRMKATYRDRHAGSHYPVRTEVWLALTSERLRRGQWTVETVPTSLTGHQGYPVSGFGYSDAAVPFPGVQASETIEIEQIQRVEVAAGGRQEGYHLIADLQPTHIPDNPQADQFLHLQYTWVWRGLGMNGWELSDPLPPLYTLAGSIGSEQFEYWSFDHRILDLGRGLQELKALTSTSGTGQEELPPSEVATPQAEPSPAVTVSGELGRVVELHQQGFLSDEEFAEAKKKILGS